MAKKKQKKWLNIVKFVFQTETLVIIAFSKENLGEPAPETYFRFHRHSRYECRNMQSANTVGFLMHQKNRHTSPH